MRKNAAWGVSVGLALVLGSAFFGPGEISAQEEACPDCWDNTETGKHKMTLWIAFYGWYPEPSDWHIDWKGSYCMFFHTAGCWVGGEEEDPFDLVVRLSVLEGEALRQFVERNRESLKVENKERFVGVRSCTGEVVLWASLTSAQARALDRDKT